MSKASDKKIRKLRRKSVWPSVVFLIVSLVIGAILVDAAISAILAYMLETKYINSRNEAVAIEKRIEKLHLEGKSYQEAIDEIEAEYSHPIAINVISKEGDYEALYGDKRQEGNAVYDEDELDFHIIFDTDKVTVDMPDNDLKVSIKEIFRRTIQIATEEEYGDKFADKLNYKVYELNYWIERNIEESDKKLYIEFEDSLTLNDCIFVVITAAVTGIIYVVLIVICFINVISNIIAQRQLIKLLFTDSSTGGNNNLAYQFFVSKALTSLFNRKYEYAVVDYSVAKYKNYCTLYGTEEGEKMLFALDECLKKHLKKGETHARVSNADFAMLLKVKPGEDAVDSISKRLQMIIDTIPEDLKAVKCKDGSFVKGLKNINQKAGVYIVKAAVDEDNINRRSKKKLNVEQLYIKAGIAKRELGDDDCIKFYSHSMWENEVWEQKVEDKMQEALDNQEFQVYIQPKYNPVTDELAGGEALVRWISPEDGFISPGQFIPIFERTGFVTKLDDYMITHTAQLQSKWYNEGKKIVPISVNVSRAHFVQPDLAEHIRDLVDQYPLPHKYIEIELTESAFFDDKNALLTTVKRLQEYGFEVSMDDFGAGYSSLNSLKDLPLNVLKLDAEFFRGDDFDTRGEIVVSKAIALAKQLDMRIVAEGVEKKEQVEFLAKQECDMIQGYYYAKPMPADEYEGRMS